MKKNRTVWSNRLSKGNSKNFQRIGSSIHVDKRLYREDIFASIVHAKMLIKQRIVPKKDGLKIIKGLKKIEKEINKNKFKFREQFEDILEIQQENFGEYGDRQLATLSELVRIDILLGNTRASRRHLLAMLEFKDMMSPTEVGNALTILGDWDQTLGQTETALKYYQEAHRLLTVKQPSLGIQHFSTPKLINFIPPPSPVDIQGNHTRYIWSSVLVRFNISSLGIANNIEIMEPSISGLMDSLYIARLSEAVYRPRLVDGEPLDTIGVFYRHNFRYFIEDN